MPAIDALLEGLTDAQRAAASHVDGALLVLAGPGSGKTRVITRRVAYLVSVGIPAWQILAVTFTNKAAGEMRERIDALVPSDVPGRRGLTVCTFHSLCVRLLRRHAERAGIPPGFAIYDTSDQREAMKSAIKEVGLDSATFAPAAMQSAISKAKNDLVGAEEYAQEARDFRERNIAKIYAGYERTMARNAALDFDDLLLRSAKLLRGDAEVRGEVQQRFRYLLVDEYQDTNKAQFLIASLIAQEHGNICVVGDPDQSIYGWRGADLRNILDFEAQFPGAVVIPLGENFRSTGRIVAAAAALIGHNRRRRAKKLFTSLGDGEPVEVVACGDERREAALVVDHLRRWSDAGVPWREMAVLYRLNALSRVLEESLRDSTIPYVIARGTAFFDRKEVRDALAYLRLVSNAADAVSLARIVNVPTRGLGDTSLDRVEAWAASRGIALLEAMRHADGIDGLSVRAKAAAVAFVAMIDRWRGHVVSTSGASAVALANLVRAVIVESGLFESYRKLDQKEGDRAEGEDRVANLDELVSAAAQFETPETDEGAVRPVETLADRLAAWLESVALVSDADAIDPTVGAVTLMTLHAAKGLEFDAVAMVGLEQNLLPHARAQESENELEEERRLCFVGMTRARRHLLMTSARFRTLRGQSERTIESQFLRELPADAIVRTGGPEPRRALEAIDDSGAYDAVDDLSAWDEHGGTSRGAGPRDSLRGLAVGCMVRHPLFGLGRVDAVMPRGASSSVRVSFREAGVKTLVVEYAGLVRVG